MVCGSGNPSSSEPPERIVGLTIPCRGLEDTWSKSHNNVVQTFYKHCASPKALETERSQLTNVILALSFSHEYCRDLGDVQYFWSHSPSTATVLDTSNIPPNHTLASAGCPEMAVVNIGLYIMV